MGNNESILQFSSSIQECWAGVLEDTTLPRFQHPFVDLLMNLACTFCTWWHHLPLLRVSWRARWSPSKKERLKKAAYVWSSCLMPGKLRLCSLLCCRQGAECEAFRYLKKILRNKQCVIFLWNQSKRNRVLRAFQFRHFNCYYAFHIFEKCISLPCIHRFLKDF